MLSHAMANKILLLATYWLRMSLYSSLIRLIHSYVAFYFSKSQLFFTVNFLKNRPIDFENSFFVAKLSAFLQVFVSLNFFLKLFLFSSVFVCTSNVQRIFYAKYCRTMFFAHMGCAVALTANRNKIVFYLLKSSFKM